MRPQGELFGDAQRLCKLGYRCAEIGAQHCHFPERLMRFGFVALGAVLPAEFSGSGGPAVRVVGGSSNR